MPVPVGPSKIRALPAPAVGAAASSFRCATWYAWPMMSSRDRGRYFAARSSAREPVAVRQRYGPTLNGTSMLLARRLVEAGVPFVSVFWMETPKLNELCKSGGGWDTHGNNFNCLKDRLLPELDRPFAALLDDLHQRGMLDTTLVIVTSEMGRKPKIGDRRSGGVGGAGRDHWTACMSVLLGGGGIKGGQVVGKTDRDGAVVTDRPISVPDFLGTVCTILGIDYKRKNHPAGVDRPIPIVDTSKGVQVLSELL